ncbi:hypothetical protein ACLKA6_000854 [Drosophila palustris]
MTERWSSQAGYPGSGTGILFGREVDQWNRCQQGHTLSSTICHLYCPVHSRKHIFLKQVDTIKL